MTTVPTVRFLLATLVVASVLVVERAQAACMPGGPCITVTPPSIGRDRPYREPREHGGGGGGGGGHSQSVGPSNTDIARGNLTTGNAYYREHNWQKALEQYDAGLRLAGASALRRALEANWYAVRAIMAREAGNLRQAALDMEKEIDVPTWWDILTADDDSHQQRKAWLRNIKKEIEGEGPETQECSWTGERIPPKNGVCVYDCSKSGTTLIPAPGGRDCLAYIDNVPVPPDDSKPSDDDNGLRNR